MLDPATISAIIIAVVSAVGTLVLAVCKLIKKSSCCWGGFNVETRDNEVTERSDLQNK